MTMGKKFIKVRRPSSGGNCNSSSSCSSGEGGVMFSTYTVPTVLPHDLVAAEVLTRLPAKSLMRFKCVSKLWLSTILDPHFCKSHRARSGPRSHESLLIVSRDDNDEEGGGGEQHDHHAAGGLGLGLGFFVATRSRGVAHPWYFKPLGPQFRDVFDLLHHQFTISTTRHVEGVTEVLEGCLVCFYNLNRAWLCSVTTGEIMELPPPPPSPSPSPSSTDTDADADADAISSYKYYLGCDPRPGRFKVLRVISIQGALVCISHYDILTLGGAGEEEEDGSQSWRWRRLEGAPPIHVDGIEGGNNNNNNNSNSVCIDGTLYWWHSSGCFLVRFWFRDEEFQLIELPPGFPERGGSLHEFLGHLALVPRFVGRELLLWLLLHVYVRDEEEEGLLFPVYEKVWYEHTLRIPSALADCGYGFLGSLENGLTLMTGTTLEQEHEQPQRQLEEEEVNDSKSPFKATPPIYSYDRVFGQLDQLVLGGTFYSTSLVGKKLSIYSYAEDIRPLKIFLNNS